MSFEVDSNEMQDAMMMSASDNSSDNFARDRGGIDDTLWMSLWILSLVLFVCFPFCGTRRRRQLWLRRIRERRWIEESHHREDEFYRAMMERQRERRRQHLAEQQEAFDISKTQQDEIRQQFVLAQLSPFTMKLEKLDIIATDDNEDAIVVEKSESACCQSDIVANTSDETEETNDAVGTTLDGDNVENPVITDDIENPVADNDIENPSNDADSVENEEELPSEIENSNAVDTPELSVIVQDDDLDSLPETAADIENPMSDFEANIEPLTAPSEEDAEVQSRPRADSNDSMDILEAFEDTTEVISVPLAGYRCNNNTNDEENKNNINIPKRHVPNGCAICLCPFSADESVTWSCNQECQHIFHDDCILHWFLTVGRKTQLRRERRQQSTAQNEVQAISEICDFPMLCPCCRQVFSKREDDTDKSAKK